MPRIAPIERGLPSARERAHFAELLRTWLWWIEAGLYMSGGCELAQCTHLGRARHEHRQWQA